MPRCRVIGFNGSIEHQIHDPAAFEVAPETVFFLDCVCVAFQMFGLPVQSAAGKLPTQNSSRYLHDFRKPCVWVQYLLDNLH